MNLDVTDEIAAGNVLLSIQRETACNQFRSRVDFDIGIVENFLKHYLITHRPNCDFVSLLSNPPDIERPKDGTRMDSIAGELGSSAPPVGRCAPR